MATILWESDDQFNNIYQIWEGNITQALARIYSNCNYAYIAWRTITRVIPGSGVERNPTVISPEQLSADSSYLLSNYISDFGMAWYTVIISTPEGNMWSGPCPENEGSWIEASGVSPTPIDIVFPDMPQSPRFVVGVSGTPWVIVVYAPSGLAGRLNTDWSSMNSAVTVTDLEATRII